MHIGKVAFAAALAALPAAAQAVVIDFEGLTVVAGTNKAFTTYSQDGYTVTGGIGDYDEAPGFGFISKGVIGGSSTTKTNGTLTITGPGLFSFASLDYYGFGAGSTRTYTFTGLLNNTQVYSQSGTFVDPPFGYTKTSGVAGTIDKLVIQTSGFYIDLDNITVSGASASVPEPASWAMMICGFGLIGGTMRRRQAATVRFA